MGRRGWGELWPAICSVLGEVVHTVEALGCGHVALSLWGKLSFRPFSFGTARGSSLSFIRKKVSEFGSIAYHTLLITV